jgi:hypothetical protein
MKRTRYYIYTPLYMYDTLFANDTAISIPARHSNMNHNGYLCFEPLFRFVVQCEHTSQVIYMKDWFVGLKLWHGPWLFALPLLLISSTMYIVLRDESTTHNLYHNEDYTLPNEVWTPNQTTIGNVICANPYLHIRTHYGTTARTKYVARTHPIHSGYAQSKSIYFYATKLVFGTRFLLFK